MPRREKRRKTFDFWFRFFSFNIYESAFTIPSTTPHRSIATNTKHSPIRDHTYKRQRTLLPSYIDAQSLLFRQRSIRTSDHLLPAICFVRVNFSSTVNGSRQRPPGKFRVETLNTRTSCRVASPGFPRVSRSRKVIESARGASAERPSERAKHSRGIEREAKLRNWRRDWYVR